MSAKAVLAFSFSLFKINELWGFTPRMGHKTEYCVEDHKVA